MNAYDKNRAAYERKGQQQDLASIFDLGVKAMTDGQAALDAIPNLVGRIESLEKRSTDVNVSATLKQPAKPKNTAKTIDGLRIAAAVQAAEGIRYANHTDHADTLRALLPNDGNRILRRVASDKLKGAVDTGTTMDVGFGAEIAETEVSTFYKRMEEISVFAQLKSRATSFVFGRNASITIPQRPIASEGQLTGEWTGEKASIVVKQSSLGSASLFRHKKAVITVATNDLLRVTQGTLELFEDMIAADTSIMIDSDAFDPTNGAVASLSPASFYFGAATQPSAGTTFANIVSDIRWLKQQMVTARMANPVITMSDNRKLGLAMALNSDESMPFMGMVEAGNIFGIPILSSAYHPDDVVGVIDAKEAMIAADPVEFSTSDHATLVMLDNQAPDPKMGSEAGVQVSDSVDISDAAAKGTEVRGMLQTDAVALRMILPISYGLRTAGTSSYLSAVAW